LRIEITAHCALILFWDFGAI